MSERKAKDNGKRIVVVEEGNVFIGTPGTDRHTLLDASVIRIWGTTAGLGQLALHGMQKDTVLDFAGTVEINPNKELFRLVCIF